VRGRPGGPDGERRAEVAARPRTDYVARLWGSPPSGGGRRPRGQAVRWRACCTSAAPATGPAYAAFRPAAVSLYPARPARFARNVWAGNGQRAGTARRRRRVQLDRVPGSGRPASSPRSPPSRSPSWTCAWVLRSGEPEGLRHRGLPGLNRRWATPRLTLSGRGPTTAGFSALPRYFARSEKYRGCLWFRHPLSVVTVRAGGGAGRHTVSGWG
jgi:hypothetical protein